jgi:hypothetical protein
MRAAACLGPAAGDDLAAAIIDDESAHSRIGRSCAEYAMSEP